MFRPRIINLVPANYRLVVGDFHTRSVYRVLDGEYGVRPKPGGADEYSARFTISRVPADCECGVRLKPGGAAGHSAGFTISRVPANSVRDFFS